MVEINVTLQHINPGEIRNMFSGLGYNFVLTSESTRLFDVCNAFIDARRRWSVSDDIRMGTDTVVFRLIRKGAITQVPKLERDEMMEFIAKITSAMSSVPKLNILCNCKLLRDGHRNFQSNTSSPLANVSGMSPSLSLPRRTNRCF